jgi:hypothetical protein
MGDLPAALPYLEQAEAFLQQIERYPCADGQAHIIPETHQVSPWLWPITLAVLGIALVAAWVGARKI